MVEEASHAKQLFLNNVCKIGLKPMTQISQPFDYEQRSTAPLRFSKHIFYTEPEYENSFWSGEDV
jgi:hypothetical protein